MLKYKPGYSESMKYQLLSIITAFGLLLALLASVGTLPIVSAQTDDGCYWKYIPGIGSFYQCLPTDLPRNIPNSGPWAGHYSNDYNILALNPQPLPPIDCPMCGAIVLDKSLFDSVQEIKISPQQDGSIIISTINSSASSNLNTMNSINQ